MSEQLDLTMPCMRDSIQWALDSLREVGEQRIGDSDPGVDWLGKVYVAVAEQLPGLLDELRRWRECAKYDATMDGTPAFKGWDRSALDRLRREYEAAQAGRRDNGESNVDTLGRNRLSATAG